MTSRGLITSRIGAEVDPPQTDGLVLKTALSVWENEGGAPVRVTHVTREERGRMGLAGKTMIDPGTILVEQDATLPQCFVLGAGSYPNAWRRVTHGLTFRKFEDELAATGWTFFYMATSIKMTAFGFDRAKMVPAALRRLIASVIQQGCNSLEIDSVTLHSFLGLRYARVAAHPRHIQKGMFFSSPTDFRAITKSVLSERRSKWVF